MPQDLFNFFIGHGVNGCGTKAVLLGN